MTLEEVRKEQKDLINNIETLLNDFSKKTKLNISNLTIRDTLMSLNDCEKYFIDLEVKL